MDEDNKTAPQDERAAFEAAMKNRGYKVLYRAGDHYFGDGPECAWQGWQARAALSAPTTKPSTPSTFPASIWGLLHEVADRKGTEHTGPWEGPDGKPLQDDADAAIAWINGMAALSAAAKPAPEGWKLVPVEPDLGMLQAALEKSREFEESNSPLRRCRELHDAGVVYAAMLSAAPSAPVAAPAVPGQWQPIETAPKDGRKLILSYKNGKGLVRTIFARWLTDEEAAESDDDDVGLTGGWYECIDNWDDYSQVAVHEGEPTHWMPLPSAPGAEQAKPGMTDEQINAFLPSAYVGDAYVGYSRTDLCRLARAIERHLAAAWGVKLEGGV